MKTLTLSVKQRLLLKPLLPASGRRIEMMVVSSLGQQIDFSAEEIQAFELKDGSNGTVRGNPQRFVDKDIALSDEQVKILKEIPVRVDDARQVTLELLPLLDLIDAL